RGPYPAAAHDTGHWAYTQENSVPYTRQGYIGDRGPDHDRQHTTGGRDDDHRGRRRSALLPGPGDGHRHRPRPRDPRLPPPEAGTPQTPAPHRGTDPRPAAHGRRGRLL